MKPIGIYVHHHSDGHCQRAIAIASQAPDYFTLLGTGLKGKTGTLSIVDLPDDRAPSMYADIENHYDSANISPLYSSSSDHNRIRRRTRLIMEWIEAAEPALLLVDASVEIAMLAKLASTPTAYMRLSGNRIDQPHLEAFNAAEAILCPFHKVLESETTPQWLRERSHYFPGITNTIRANRQNEKKLLIVLGKGQSNIEISQFAKAARALPDWQIDVIGWLRVDVANAPNLHFHGWVNNPEHFIAEATVIAGKASDSLISSVSAAGKPFICLPQARPFDEQYEKAARLEALRAAVVCRQWPTNWKKTIASALKHGSAMAALHDEQGAARAAEFLLDMAYGARRLNAKSFANDAVSKLAAG